MIFHLFRVHNTCWFNQNDMRTRHSVTAVVWLCAHQSLYESAWADVWLLFLQNLIKCVNVLKFPRFLFIIGWVSTLNLKVQPIDANTTVGFIYVLTNQSPSLSHALAHCVCAYDDSRPKLTRDFWFRSIECANSFLFFVMRWTKDWILLNRRKISNVPVKYCERRLTSSHKVWGESDDINHRNAHRTSYADYPFWLCTGCICHICSAPFLLRLGHHLGIQPVKREREGELFLLFELVMVFLTRLDCLPVMRMVK